MTIHFEIIREGDLYSARADGDAKFAVGKKVHYRNKRTGDETVGLANDNSALAKKFNCGAANFSQAFDFWGFHRANCALRRPKLYHIKHL